MVSLGREHLATNRTWIFNIPLLPGLLTAFKKVMHLQVRSKVQCYNQNDTKAKNKSKDGRAAELSESSHAQPLNLWRSTLHFLPSHNHMTKLPQQAPCRSWIMEPWSTKANEIGWDSRGLANGRLLGNEVFFKWQNDRIITFWEWWHIYIHYRL